MPLIYIVEDDPSIREIETIALKNSNYTVAAFERASAFFAQTALQKPDLVLLDIMLPDEDGYAIIRKLRADPATKALPVIMITAKTAEMDLLKALDGGADDYIKKPFSVMELLSRVRALLRRSKPEEVAVLTVGDIVLNHDRHSVCVCGSPITLTYKEYELLRCFMTNAGIVLSRDTLLQAVWNTDFEGESRTVDMHIKTLRQKLGESGASIRTVRNVGYVLDKPEVRA